MKPAFPDYAGGSIVNLMQSIATACGARPETAAPYPELGLLPAAQLGEARHIVLLVIDGLGQRTLERHAAAHLRRRTLGTITSVFPSTTASAITTFMTGLAPAQHAVTGWHMHLAEIDQTLAILPLTPRSPPARIPPEQLPELLFRHATLFQQLERESWVLAPQSIADSPFNLWHARGAQRATYADLPTLFRRLAELLKAEAAPRYIYAYYPDLDSVSHRYGCDSLEAQKTLLTFETLFEAFLRDIEGSHSWVIATADHGFIDSPAERCIDLAGHPQLTALLARPLCGERRAAYCYIKDGQHAAFETYVQTHLAHCTQWQRSSELIESGWFGKAPAHARLVERVGDYTLLMRDNWTIKDWLPGEKRYRMLGVHGGISADEMRVPLIAHRA